MMSYGMARVRMKLDSPSVTSSMMLYSQCASWLMTPF